MSVHLVFSKSSNTAASLSTCLFVGVLLIPVLVHQSHTLLYIHVVLGPLCHRTSCRRSDEYSKACSL